MIAISAPSVLSGMASFTAVLITSDSAASPTVCERREIGPKNSWFLPA